MLHKYIFELYKSFFYLYALQSIDNYLSFFIFFLNFVLNKLKSKSKLKKKTKCINDSMKKKSHHPKFKKKIIILEILL